MTDDVETGVVEDPDVREREFREWLRVGVERGWCSEPVCATHDGLPRTDAEDQAWEDGWDPCEHAVRLWRGDEDDVFPVDSSAG